MEPKYINHSLRPQLQGSVITPKQEEKKNVHENN